MTFPILDKILNTEITKMLIRLCQIFSIQHFIATTKDMSTLRKKFNKISLAAEELIGQK